MYKTIEAIYDNGQIISIEEPINIKRGKVLITILEEEPDNVRGIRISPRIHKTTYKNI